MLLLRQGGIKQHKTHSFFSWGHIELVLYFNSYLQVMRSIVSQISHTVISIKLNSGGYNVATTLNYGVIQTGGKMNWFLKKWK